jgi:hypothetical protein
MVGVKSVMIGSVEKVVPVTLFHEVGCLLGFRR